MRMFGLGLKLNPKLNQAFSSVASGSGKFAHFMHAEPNLAFVSVFHQVIGPVIL